MNQIQGLWTSLNLRQRITLAVAALAVAGAMFYLVEWRKEADFKPLFTGLASEDAGALLARLRETGVEYRLAEGGSTILVPSAKAAEMRIQMAASGLPKSGRMGFELFDKANFGATEFAEQVNYHRALEGELERSVMSLAEVEQARVHITAAKDSVYTELRQPAKASVLVKLRTGAHLQPANVAAICQLAASAIEGLSPEAVSVLDTRGDLLSRPRRPGTPEEASDTLLEYRQRMERDILAKVDATLEPLLGAGRYRAGVAVDCDFSSSEQSEESFDPNRSVMTSSQKTEDVGGAATAGGGIPGTASNLPRPPARPPGSGSAMSRRTENIAYQTSRLVKHSKTPQGVVRRVSVSVVLDQTIRWDGVGEKAKRIIEPPTPQRLKVVRDVVSGVAGISTDRGDQVLVETLPFDTTLNAEPPAAPSKRELEPSWVDLLRRQKSFPVMVGIGLGAVLALVAVLWFFARRRPKIIEVSPTPALEAGATGEGTHAHRDAGEQLEAKLAEQLAQKEIETAMQVAALKLPEVHTKKTEVLAKHFTTESKKDPQALAQVVRSWLNATEN